MKKLCLVLSFCGFCLHAFGDALTQGSNPEEMKAKMAEMMKLGSPTEGHKALSDMVGKFTYTLKWWESANSAPQESTGKSTSKWIFGGRFIQQDIKAKMKGMTGKDVSFEGMGITGYDNIRAEYQSVWFDNMATGMMWTAGTLDTGTKTLVQNGTASCHMTGNKNKEYRNVLKIVDKDHHTFEMYTKGADGQSFKAMEIAYQRAKSSK